MSIRLMLFFMMSFFLLSGCLYSCNYQPEDEQNLNNGGDSGGSIKNPDPCDQNGSSTLMRFIDISQTGSRLKVSMIMKLPCTSQNTGDTYSLAFYPTKSLVEPSSLYSLNFKGQFEAKQPSCKANSNEQNIEIIKKYKDYYALSQGSGISFMVGKKTTNHLYPVYIKTSINNDKAVGTGNGILGNCLGGDINFSPFNVERTKMTAIYQNNQPISANGSELPGTLALYANKLVIIGAPFYTYGTVFSNDSQGIIPVDLTSTKAMGISRNILIDGSLFEFEIDIQPGSYYIVLSQVVDPMAAVWGDFSLKNIKVYNRYVANQFKDYKTECGNTVTCGSPVTVR